MTIDNVCKIIPLSKQMIFFGIGITTGPYAFNARDIARDTQKSVADDLKLKILEIGGVTP